MKTHTNDFKNKVKLHGREIDSVITYQLNGETIELGNEDLNSVTPHYESGILKSTMRQLDIDSNVYIPIATTINYRFGIKVRDNDVDDYRENYDYINYGNYIVYSVEKQEDKKSYKIICYDKMLYSMIDYFSLNINYPITIRDYINTICNILGLVFKNRNDTFANYDKQIQSELYLDSGGNSLNYTFRDVFDELAQATGSTICINEDDDQLEIRYINDTHDTIDEEYLKDINVNFGEKYGPINSIVLSRSAETDNVYIQDSQSIATNGLCEIKIKDNQIMNWNDRSDYLPDLLSRLGGLEYYLNDFTSTGIMYYNLCDRYSVKIGDVYYSCIMFNDESNVTQGLKEIIHTDMPVETETDYTKADKTDRKINQTYLIVDKQNQTIQSVVSQTVDTSNPDSIASKQSVLTQRVDNIESSITDIADLTISGESTQATVNLDNINQSEPIVINVRPISQNVSYLYPRDNLYPSDTLYMTDRKVRFHNNTTNENIDYILPDDLLYYDSENYDEFMLDYNSQTCKVMKKCKYNADGTVSLLDNSVINTYTYPTVELTNGDYTVSLLGYNTGYLFIRLMSKNIYTEQFYTKSETNSLINQTASSINLSVDQKLTNYSTTTEMNSAISLKANEINSTVSQNYATKTELSQTSTNLQSQINQTASSITSSVAETYATKDTTNSLSSRINQTAKSINLSVNDNGTSAGLNIKLLNEDGTQIDSKDANITMSGLVKFTDLSTSGSTTINGANIETGTLSASKITTGTLNGNNVSITNLNASNIRTGTLNGNNVSITNLKAGNIVSGTLNGNNVTITNLKAGNIVSGTLNGIPITNGTYTFTKGGQTLRISTQYSYGIFTLWSSGTIRAVIDSGSFDAYNSSGSLGAYLNYSGVHTTSDIRYKKHIKEIEEKKSINVITNLTPIEYDYDTEEKHRGLSAQEVEEILNKNGYKNQVYNIDKDGKYSLNYIELIPDLINCIKYQQEEINNLKKEMEELRNAKN